MGRSPIGRAKLPSPGDTGVLVEFNVINVNRFLHKFALKINDSANFLQNHFLLEFALKINDLS